MRAAVDLRTPVSLLPLALHEVAFAVGEHPILHGITLTLDAGPRSVIVGPNGAGKSVLLRLCHGLLKPTSGRIVWNSPEVPGAPRRQAMVFQRPVMLRRSALANIVYALECSGVLAPWRQDRALAALERVGLAGSADRPARVLSGGQQQRLALARAWALDPEVLFLDEPTASLDPGAAQEIEGVIQSMHASGTKIVMVTHNLGQARRLGDEILFMHQGRIAERAPADRFFREPHTPQAAQFLEGELPW